MTWGFRPGPSTRCAAHRVDGPGRKTQVIDYHYEVAPDLIGQKIQRRKLRGLARPGDCHVQARIEPGEVRDLPRTAALHDFEILGGEVRHRTPGGIERYGVYHPGIRSRRGRRRNRPAALAESHQGTC